MQEVVYHSNFSIEESYFWFLARNKIVNKVFQSITNLPKGDNVIDIGCGTGGFAKILSENYKVTCLDTEPIALEYCSKRGLSDLHNCILSDFQKGDRKLTAAFMLDVIEHIEDDKSVVKEVYDLLEPGGYFISTVPAYQWLWSYHDVMHMHYRRYNINNFSNLIQNAGFQVKYSSYFNTFLFPPAFLKRMLDKTDPNDIKGKPPVDEVAPWMNKLFKSIFSAESSFLPNLSFPFGLSIIVVSQKK
jgi:SAM-dependent methyltransferase